MSKKELHRRQVTGMISSDAITKAISSLHLVDSSTMFQEPGTDEKSTSGPLVEFLVHCSSPCFQAPPTVLIPVVSNDTFGKFYCTFF